jgi:carboxymethylenebutenolidase
VFPPADSSVSTGLILVHEEWGLTDWTKSVSSQIADQGYLVIVPDLLSGYGIESDTINYLVNEDVIRTELLSTKPKQNNACP